MAYKPEATDRGKVSLISKPKQYGNDHPYVVKLLDVVSDMQIQKSGTEFSTIMAVSGHSGYLCNQANIYEFRWNDPYSALKPHFLTQGNFNDILCIEYLYRSPIFLAKEGQDMNFYRIRSNNKFQLLGTSKFNPFDQNCYKNAICISYDREFIFLRESQNKVVLFRHKNTKTEGTVVKKIGMSEFNNALSVHNMFYEHRSKLLLILFSNCQYAVDSVNYSTGKEQFLEQ